MRLTLLTIMTLMVVEFLQSAQAEDVTIAVATNFKPTLEELAAAFEANTEHDVTIVSGSTGKLYAQIRNGAPFDVFLSADHIRTRQLVLDGIADEETLFVYAVGRLVLWAPEQAKAAEDILQSQSYRRLSIANPELAPYGLAATQVLTRLKTDSDRVVYGENIGQAFSFVQTRNADIGFVALSQLSTPRDANAWLVPSDLHDPILQEAVLLPRKRANSAGPEFLHFLRSDSARQIIQQAGYDLP